MAGRLAKRLGQTDQELKLYQRLAEALPAMPMWKDKLKSLKSKTVLPIKPKVNSP